MSLISVFRCVCDPCGRTITIPYSIVGARLALALFPDFDTFKKFFYNALKINNIKFRVGVAKSRKSGLKCQFYTIWVSHCRSQDPCGCQKHHIRNICRGNPCGCLNKKGEGKPRPYNNIRDGNCATARVAHTTIPNKRMHSLLTQRRKGENAKKANKKTNPITLY
ncbi:MAG: hypothetical protein FWH18_09665 [Marinilabiliaceae bacterium]|nr:hypothetical protein [Marinilabiliaceae bacterium]